MQYKIDKLVIGILILSIIILIIPNVLAQDIAFGETENIIEGIKEVLTPISEALLGAVGTGEALFSKFLLFILVAVIIYGVVGFIPGFENKPGIATTISIIVSILGVRFLATENIINAILLPYGSLFIALSVGIPFVIFFFVLQKIENPLVRRAGWVLFIAAFGVLGWMRADEIGKAGYIYVVAIGLALIAFSFDGTLQRFLRGAKIARAEERTMNVETERALARLDDLTQRLGRATDPNEITNLKRQITRQKSAIKELQSV